MTPDLSAIRARAEAATPHDKAACDAFGPHMGCSYCWGVVRPEPYLLTLPGEHEERALVPDAAFWDAVAHLELARDDRAALLAEVERLSRNLELASAECCDLSAYRQLVREEHPAELERVARWVATELRPDLSPAEIDALVAEALEAPRG